MLYAYVPPQFLIDMLFSKNLTENGDFGIFFWKIGPNRAILLIKRSYELKKLVYDARHASATGFRYQNRSLHDF